MKTQYDSTNLRANTLKLIEQANKIIEEYQAQGFNLTLRQVYYQFVARGLIENNLKAYNHIGIALNRGRMCGLIDWEAIVDRTRTTYANSHWHTPQDVLYSAANSYKLDTRKGQPNYVEVWIEKNALLGVIEPICQKLDITYLPCIGYYSLSAMWRAANRFKQQTNNCIIFHLGDHDPSGIDMTRDIQDRLTNFGASVDVKRIALTIAQIRKYNPPPNPTKTTDSRANDYIAKYGDESWELDALSPTMIAKLIETDVNHVTDHLKVIKLEKQQEAQRERLQKIAEDYED